MNGLGHTRSRRGDHHTFIAPDSHVFTRMPGWVDSQCATLISPEMDARFALHLIDMGAGAESAAPEASVSRFIFVLAGELTCITDHGEETLGIGGYAFFPPAMSHRLRTDQPARLVVIEKPFVSMERGEVPGFTFGHEGTAASEPGKIPGTSVKRLLDDSDAHDMAINVLSFEPGASLPLVEVHIMEHGLIMLRGGGIYRLGDDWYPIAQGDALWMGSYCPQWFGALGTERAAYLLYKDINRDPLSPLARTRNGSGK